MYNRKRKQRNVRKVGIQLKSSRNSTVIYEKKCMREKGDGLKMTDIDVCPALLMTVKL